MVGDEHISDRERIQQQERKEKIYNIPTPLLLNLKEYIFAVRFYDWHVDFTTLSLPLALATNQHHCLSLIQHQSYLFLLFLLVSTFNH